MKNDIIMTLKMISKREIFKKLIWQRINESFNKMVWRNVDSIYSLEVTMNSRRKLMPFG